jgi:hypothetical protein
MRAGGLAANLGEPPYGDRSRIAIRQVYCGGGEPRRPARSPSAFAPDDTPPLISVACVPD